MEDLFDLDSAEEKRKDSNIIEDNTSNDSDDSSENHVDDFDVFEIQEVNSHDNEVINEQNECENVEESSVNSEALSQVEEDAELNEDKVSDTVVEEEHVDLVMPVPESKDFEVKEIDGFSKSPIELDYDNFGETFRRLREFNNISIEKLSKETHIKEQFLIAFENEDYENLPVDAYVLAYIRRLGIIYKLSDQDIALLGDKIKQRLENIIFEVPADAEKVVLAYEHSDENAEKIRKIFIFSILIILLILGIVGSLFFFFLFDGDEEASGTTTTKYVDTFRSEELMEVQNQPKLQIRSIPMPQE